MEDTCVICGRVIPEGRQVCPACEQKQNETEDNSQKVPAQTKKTENSPRHKKAFKAGSSLESVGDQRIEKYGNKRICRVDMEPLTYVMYAR